jgi:hypothetical protein
VKTVCSNSIDVGVPVGRVFDFTTDVTRWPLWLSFVVSAQRDQREMRLGEEMHLCLSEGRDRCQEDFELTRYVHNAFFWLEGALSAARRIELRFEQRAERTRVAMTIGYPVFGGWFGRALDSIGRRRRLQSALTDSLVHLKSVLEDKAAQQQMEDVTPIAQAKSYSEDALVEETDKEPQFA